MDDAWQGPQCKFPAVLRSAVLRMRAPLPERSEVSTASGAQPLVTLRGSAPNWHNWDSTEMLKLVWKQ